MYSIPSFFLNVEPCLECIIGQLYAIYQNSVTKMSGSSLWILLLAWIVHVIDYSKLYKTVNVAMISHGEAPIAANSLGWIEVSGLIIGLI